MLRLITMPVRAGYGAGKLSTKVGWRTARFVGFKRLALLAVGVAIGLLLAPVPGRELRARIKEALAGGGGGVDLGERVRFELSHSPSTWNLPQPAVDVEGGRVILRGEAPNATAKADLERAATSVPGVATVDNLLEISGTNGHR